MSVLEILIPLTILGLVGWYVIYVIKKLSHHNTKANSREKQVWANGKALLLSVVIAVASIISLEYFRILGAEADGANGRSWALFILSPFIILAICGATASLYIALTYATQTKSVLNRVIAIFYGLIIVYFLFRFAT